MEKAESNRCQGTVRTFILKKRKRDGKIKHSQGILGFYKNTEEMVACSDHDCAVALGRVDRRHGEQCGCAVYLHLVLIKPSFKRADTA